MTDLKSYFESKRGLGVLSTADQNGIVDCAIYSRPHVMEDGTIAFIMNDRLSHHNLQSNPHAAYLFRENKEGFDGKRLLLTKVAEEKDTERLAGLKRRQYPPEKAFAGPMFLVFFKIEKELPLIGPGEED
jgi:hypothetical protein